LNRGDVFEAYHLYLQAGLHSAAHELAVFELAPEAVIRNDLELVKVLFERFVGHAVDEWHVRGKVRKVALDQLINPPDAITVVGLPRLRSCHGATARIDPRLEGVAG
jgi:nuclear pore complex protein Nup98-Nup96